MNFLTPLFLVGALAIGGPILFHLIRRAARERMAFSSLMFLRPTPPKMTRRRKLEHFWLLVLRCLVLILLAGAFARPFFARDVTLPAAPAEAKQLVLLVDTSASMKRAGLWDKAVAAAGHYLDQVGVGDEVAVVTFDRQPKALVNFSEWSSWAPDQRAALARQRLASVAPDWMGTQLGLALTAAAERFVDDSSSTKPPAHRDIILISDLQEGAKLDGLQGFEWPPGVNVIVERVDAPVKSNAGIEILADSSANSAADHAPHVRVTNARDSSREKFLLSWESANANASAPQPMEIYLAPGQTRTFSAPKLPASSTAGELQLTGDEETFDNASYYAVPQAEKIAVAYFGRESGNDPAQLRYYLQRVFAGTPRRQIELSAPQSNSVISSDTLAAALLAVIPRPLAPEEITPVHDWLAGGKTALLVLTGTNTGASLESLSGLHDLQVTEATGDYALFGEIDFTHPLFAPFDDPRFSDFAHIHFWKHRRWTVPAGAAVRVLARFDDGSPALAQVTVGKGNLLVLASGWQPADSQFAVSSKFPPMMETLLDWSGAGVPVRLQFSTGDSIPSPMSGAGDVTWRKPDGKTAVLAGGTAFADTEAPGIYSAAFGGRERQYAVNLPLEESRTTAISADELGRLGVPLRMPGTETEAQVRQRQLHLAQAELENRQKLWRWLIAAALGVTLGEIVLGGWLARRITTAEAAS